MNFEKSINSLLKLKTKRLEFGDEESINHSIDQLSDSKSDAKNNKRII